MTADPSQTGTAFGHGLESITTGGKVSDGVANANTGSSECDKSSGDTNGSSTMTYHYLYKPKFQLPSPAIADQIRNAIKITAATHITGKSPQSASADNNVENTRTPVSNDVPLSTVAVTGTNTGSKLTKVIQSETPLYP